VGPIVFAVQESLDSPSSMRGLGNEFAARLRGHRDSGRSHPLQSDYRTTCHPNGSNQASAVITSRPEAALRSCWPVSRWAWPRATSRTTCDRRLHASGRSGESEQRGSAVRRRPCSSCLDERYAAKRVLPRGKPALRAAQCASARTHAKGLLMRAKYAIRPPERRTTHDVATHGCHSRRRALGPDACSSAARLARIRLGRCRDRDRELTPSTSLRRPGWARSVLRSLCATASRGVARGQKRSLALRQRTLERGTR